MSQRSDQLSRVRAWADALLVEHVGGTADRPTRDALIDAGFNRANAWSESESWLLSELPPGDEDSDAPTETFDSQERRNRIKAVRRATRAMDRLPKLVRQLHDVMREIHTETIWLTSQVDAEKDFNVGLPGCKSCARSQGRTGGHFQPIYGKAISSGLCRQCYDYERVEHQLPPIMWCHLRYTMGGKPAARWLAENTPKTKAPELEPPCGSTFWHEGVTLTCHRAQGHDQGHAGVDIGGNRVTWESGTVAA